MCMGGGMRGGMGSGGKKEFDVEVTENGLARVEFGDMSGPHHKNAHEFLDFLAELGITPVGEVESTKGKIHKHVHGTGEVHRHA